MPVELNSSNHPSHNPTSLAYDNTCKYLAEKFPAAFVHWLLPIDEPTAIEVLKTELIQEPIRADSLVFLQTDNQILHLEFETRPYSDPPIAFRMLDYYVRLKRQYSCSINQVVIFCSKQPQNKFLYPSTQTRTPDTDIELSACGNKTPLHCCPSPAYSRWRHYPKPTRRELC